MGESFLKQRKIPIGFVQCSKSYFERMTNSLLTHVLEFPEDLFCMFTITYKYTKQRGFETLAQIKSNKNNSTVIYVQACSLRLVIINGCSSRLPSRLSSEGNCHTESAK